MSGKKGAKKRLGQKVSSHERDSSAKPFRRRGERVHRGAGYPLPAQSRRAGQSTENTERNAESAYRRRVFEIVRRIPAGRVMTYGQIAALLGEGYTARTVGFVMHAADDAIPWHRVINAQGMCSTTRIMLPPDKQQRLLEAEGVEFDVRGRCELARYLWHPEVRGPKMRLHVQSERR
ncbi:MAG: hypothetical protein C4334_03170 [Pyrinomonas sp.]|uniref:MGMT family protein n=1 Tax=Pyrinomonas sp. TaxID=2080306 RepID=UPI0033166CF9